MIRLIRPSLVYWILVISASTIQAQIHTEALPGEIFESDFRIDEIKLFQRNREVPLFRPNDFNLNLGQSGSLVSANKRLFYLPDGSGRVYELQKREEAIVANRIDTTFYQGYNFGAYHFSYADTLYSFGGFGFWKYNGFLRFYLWDHREWELLQLNGEQPHSKAKSTPWLDGRSGALFYATTSTMPFIRNSIKPQSAYYDTTSVWKIQISRQSIEKLGVLTPKAAEILNLEQDLISTRFGSIHFSTGADRKQLNILDYQGNRILLLNQKKSSQIIGFFDRFNNSPDRNGILTMVRSGDSILFYFPPDKNLVFPIAEKDIMDSKLKIYDSGSDLALPSSSVNWALLGMAVMMTISLGVNIYWFRKNQGGERAMVGGAFQEIEIRLLKAFYVASGNSISIEQFNQIVGIEERSMDAQKKYRSEMIRAVNNKYCLLTNTTESLIELVKSSHDKRIIRYKIQTQKFERLKSLLIEKRAT